MLDDATMKSAARAGTRTAAPRRSDRIVNVAFVGAYEGSAPRAALAKVTSQHTPRNARGIHCPAHPFRTMQHEF
jgi:hypothetical protein